MIDIEKAIHYLNISAEQHCTDALYELSQIYLNEEGPKFDIYKGINYLTLAANSNHAFAQFKLGQCYCKGKYIPCDIKKGKYYLILASNNNERLANFCIGYFYHEGKLLQRNIRNALKYYKESLINNNLAKNNIGVLYKDGFGNDVQKNIPAAMEYLNEAIKRDNDAPYLFNLANIYTYEEGFIDIDKSIYFLIKSAKEKFKPSYIFLSLVLIKNHNSNVEKIKEEINIKGGESNELNEIIFSYIKYLNLFDKSVFEQYYNKYKTVAYLYDYVGDLILSSKILNENKKEKSREIPNISSLFYEGFGIKI